MATTKEKYLEEKKSKPVETDQERRKKLNQQINPEPRRIKYNEATNQINPTTGNRYSTAYQEIERERENSNMLEFLEEKGEEFSKYIIMGENQTSGGIEMQKALARMDARDENPHNSDMTWEKYNKEIEKISVVEKIMKNAGVPLSTITDASGLNNALEGIAERKCHNENLENFLYGPPTLIKENIFIIPPNKKSTSSHFY